MLQSMTGQGHAQSSGELGTISIEIRTVNNRGLKLVARLGDRLSKFESRVDGVVRQHLTRGSVNLNARWQRTDLASAYCINVATLSAYYRSISQLQSKLGASTATDLSQLASLPGVVEEADDDDVDDDALWGQMEAVLGDALNDLNAMRRAEGAAMLLSLEQDLEVIARLVERVQSLAPGVVDAYRDRLESRIQKLIAERGMQVTDVDLLKEIQIFADRSDISEEITRLISHHQMFRETVETPEPSGRRLDFVIQEMFREVNTIGSKAGDAEIAKHVVDMKCALERMRELVQNIE